MNNERLWTKDFVLISIVNFFLIFSMFLLIVTMAAYATETYDASTSTAGLAASIFVIGILIGRLISGRIISSVGNKKILFAGLLFTLVTTLLYFPASSLTTLLIVRVLHGFGVGMASTATATMIAQITPASRKGEGISYFSLSIILAQAIGPLVGILLMQHTNYQAFFIVSFLLAAVCLVLSPMIRAADINTTKEQTKEKARHLFSLSKFFELKVIPISLVTLVIAFSYSGVISFLTVYSVEINLVEAASFYFLVYAISVLVTRPITGRLMDKKGANPIIYPVLLVFSAGMFVFSQATIGIMLLLSAAIIGIGYGNFQSVTQTIAIKMTPSHRMGLANSTYFIFLDLGFGVGPFILGMFVPYTGYRGMYTALVFVILASIGLYYLLHGRKDKALQCHQKRKAESVL